MRYHLECGHGIFGGVLVHGENFYQPTPEGEIVAPRDDERLHGNTCVAVVSFDEDLSRVWICPSWGPTWNLGGFGWMTLQAAQAVFNTDRIMYAIDVGSSNTFNWGGP